MSGRWSMATVVALAAVIHTTVGLGNTTTGGQQAEAEQSAAIEHFHRTLLEPESDAC
ncbi:hypothetical protein D3C85_1938130 [compost metagenome]